MSTQVVPNLIQGVSQQAAQQRRDTQCEEQFDCFNSVADGAGARPPSEVVKVWPGRSLAGAFFSETVRNDENYLLGVYDGEPFAINLADGTDCTITGTNSDGYLDEVVGFAPRDLFRAQVVEDTIFIVNRQVQVLMDSTILSPSTYPQAVVFVRSGGFGYGYEVVVTGKNGNTQNALSQYESPRSTVDEQVEGSSTFIANRLVNGGNQRVRDLGYPNPTPALNGQNGYRAVQEGSIFLLDRADHGDFDIITRDGNGDDFMYALKDKVAAYSKLPAKGFNGFTIGVKGEDKSKADDYYVQFKGGSSTGTWEEVVKPGIQTTLKKDTMPHVFVNTGLNSFTYGDSDWSTRIAGDEDTAKDPGFVGKKLRDVFWHQNRLALLYNGGAVWSKARYPYTFFPDTVQVVLDTAPVDVKLIPGQTSRGASDHDFAVQVDESLYIWSPRTQFRISHGQDNFRQASIESNPSTSYEYARGCTPLAVGQFLYFATDIGQFATVRSVQFQNSKANGDVDVTRHVPKYIAAGVRWLTASDTLGCEFLVTDGDPQSLYCYNFLYEQQEYLQSSWNKWRLPGGDILWASILDNSLRVLQQRPEGVALLRFNLTPKAVDPIAGAGYMTRLDMRVDETGVADLDYDTGTNRSTFKLPYAPTGPDLRVIVSESGGEGLHTRGREFRVVSVADDVVTVEGDLTPYRFYAGQRISAERLETRFFVRTDKGAEPNDRLTVDEFTVEFSDTGYTRIEVSVPHSEEPREYVWESRTAGLPDSAPGTPPIRTDKLKAPVRAKAKDAAIRIVNDSFLPSYWQAASYDYTMVKP